MVDVISNGRLDFGIGKGSEPLEYHRLNVRQEESTTRLKEGTEIIRQAWSDGEINFKGDLFEYQGFRVLPKPVQRPHPPIWVGCARSEDTFQWAGNNGFNLMTLPYLYKRKTRVCCPRWSGSIGRLLSSRSRSAPNRGVGEISHLCVGQS